MIDIRIEVREHAPGEWVLVFHIGGPDDVIMFGPFATEEAARAEAEVQREAITAAVQREAITAARRDAAPGSPEWRARIMANAEQIYVREKVDGRWQSVPFASLPADEQEDWLLRWAQQERGAL